MLVFLLMSLTEYWFVNFFKVTRQLFCHKQNYTLAPTHNLSCQTLLTYHIKVIPILTTKKSYSNPQAIQIPSKAHGPKDSKRLPCSTKIAMVLAMAWYLVLVRMSIKDCGWRDLGCLGIGRSFFFFLVKGRKKFNLLKVFDNSHRDM